MPRVDAGHAFPEVGEDSKQRVGGRLLEMRTRLDVRAVWSPAWARHCWGVLAMSSIVKRGLSSRDEFVLVHGDPLSSSLLCEPERSVESLCSAGQPLHG